MNPIALITDSARPSVLGQRPLSVPTGGKIRAGIKVLTRKAAEHPQARQLYDAGLAAGENFETIEKRILAALPDLKTPLIPRNVPYFTVRPGDFSHPGIAAELLERYGEVREDGVRRLYRFPVIFASDDWQSIMPHELACYRQSERRYWSEYSEDGQDRFCMTHASPTPRPAGAGARVVRVFGGRKAVPRPEHGGRCEPEQCPQYQARECNLSGRFIVYVPGIASMDAFEIPTNSFYAMSRAQEKLQTIRFLRGGRLSGFLDGQGTSFYISKQLRRVNHINEQGVSERVDHWLIELEAPVDVAALVRAHEDRVLALAAERSALILSGGATGAPAGLVDVGESEAPPPQAPDWREGAALCPSVSDAAPDLHGPTVAASHPAASTPAASTPAGCALPETEATQADSADVERLAGELQLDVAAVLAQLDAQLGKGWRKNQRGRARALQFVLDSARPQP